MMREQLRALAAAVPYMPDDRTYEQGREAFAEFFRVLPRESARGFTEVTTPIGSGEFARGFADAATESLTGLDYEFGEHVYERLASLDGPMLRERVRTLKVSWQ